MKAGETSICSVTYCTILHKISKKQRDQWADLDLGDTALAAAPSERTILRSTWLRFGARAACIQATRAPSRCRGAAKKLARSTIASRRADCASSIARAPQAVNGATSTSLCHSCGLKRVLAVNVVGSDAYRAGGVAGSSTAVLSTGAVAVTGSRMRRNASQAISAPSTRPTS